jgi:hypothetical protein
VCPCRRAGGTHGAAAALQHVAEQPQQRFVERVVSQFEI